MSQVLDTNVGLSRLLGPLAECFSPDVARKVAEWQADADVQARIDVWATKANKGQLIPAGGAEYDAYMRPMDVVSVLQTNARPVSQAGGCWTPGPVVTSRSLAGNRCEYCRIHQRHDLITFHVEHITPFQHHGGDDISNLALA